MQDCKEHDIVTVATTVGSLADARSLAAAAVKRQLAACVQVESITASIYRWEGAVHDEPEVRLTFKTLPHCEAELLALFDELHPYELPQFIVAAERASPAYAAWVRAEVAAA